MSVWVKICIYTSIRSRVRVRVRVRVRLCVCAFAHAPQQKFGSTLIIRRSIRNRIPSREGKQICALGIHFACPFVSACVFAYNTSCISAYIRASVLQGYRVMHELSTRARDRFAVISYTYDPESRSCDGDGNGALAFSTALSCHDSSKEFFIVWVNCPATRTHGPVFFPPVL